MPVTPGGRHLGGKRSEPDRQDHRFPDRAPHLMARAAAYPPPRRFDMRPKLPPVWDQETLGSCPAHGAPRAMLPFILPAVPTFMPSRLAAYYWGRQKEGTVDSDSGVYTRDMLKVLVDGIYDEKIWPYDITKFTQPPPDAERPFKIAGGYSSIQSQEELIAYISAGNCAPFAMMLPDYYEDCPFGVMRLRTPDDGDMGEHLQCIVGFDLDFRSSATFMRSGLRPEQCEDEVAIVANSWSDKVGEFGHWYVPISYILASRYGGDCWAIHSAGNM